MMTLQTFRRYDALCAQALTAILALAVLVHVSWNMFNPDMFGFEAIRMKQALGLILFLGAAAYVLGFGHHRKSRTAAP